MIARRIPSTYRYNFDELCEAIWSVLGKVPVTIHANGDLNIEVESLTGPQAIALKQAVMGVLRAAPQDITA